MTDSEKLQRAMVEEYVGDVSRLAPILVAEIQRLREACEVAKDALRNGTPLEEQYQAWKVVKSALEPINNKEG